MVELGNSVKVWAFGPTQYVRASIENVKWYLKDKNIKLPVNAYTPIQILYRPDLDISL